jgi:ubiquinone/menaquinone biosynthesis C-methylase UbiE
VPIIDPTDLERSTLRDLAEWPRQRVVEIGAGDGRLTWPFAREASLWLALDPDPDDIRAAARQAAGAWPSLRLLVADGRALALPAESFSLALFSWSLC